MALCRATDGLKRQLAEAGRVVSRVQAVQFSSRWQRAQHSASDDEATRCVAMPISSWMWTPSRTLHDGAALLPAVPTSAAAVTVNSASFSAHCQHAHWMRPGACFWTWR